MFVRLIVLSLLAFSIVFGDSSSSETEDSHRNRNETIVKTRYGKVRGFKYDLGRGDGSKADIFLGIPYASPPLGDLRLEEPVPPKAWKGVLDATKWAMPCAPSQLGIGQVSQNSEDCLYLNIFRPSNRNPRPPRGGYPVLVWVYGGSNAIGYAEQFGYKNLSINFIPQGVIVVSIQYRLGPFGWLSTGDSALPGNLGAWDIIETAKFLRKTIGQFGGNPNKITLWGLSSSAWLISALAITPDVNKYFDQVVIQSNSAFKARPNNDVVQSSYEIINGLNCTGNTSAEIKVCLKTKTLTEYWAVLNVTGLTRLNPLSVSVSKWGPRLDGHLFPHNITTMFKTAKPKPTYIGMGNWEAALYSIFGNLFSPFTPFILTPQQWPTIGEANFTRLLTYVIDDAFFGPQAAQARQDVFDYYTADKPGNATYVYWIKLYTELLQDWLFIFSPAIEVQSKVQAGWRDVYYYQSVHYNQYLFDKISKDAPIHGSFHTNEYAYQFGLFGLGIVFPFDDQDWAFQRVLVESIGNFAKTSNPSTSFFNWKPATRQFPNRHAVLSANSTMDDNPIRADQLAFWQSISNGKYPFNPLARVNWQNISTYACDLSTNYVC